MKWNCTQYLRNEEYPYKANLAVRIQQQNMQYPFIAYCSYSYTAYCVASTCTCVRAHTHTHTQHTVLYPCACVCARTHAQPTVQYPYKANYINYKQMQYSHFNHSTFNVSCLSLLLWAEDWDGSVSHMN